MCEFLSHAFWEIFSEISKIYDQDKFKILNDFSADFHIHSARLFIHGQFKIYKKLFPDPPENTYSK